MALPLQTLQPLQPQPGLTYPHAVANGTRHSKGSFGPVFAVLSVITVLAAIACCLGRFCARRYSQPKANHGQTFDGGRRPDPEGGLKDGSTSTKAKPAYQPKKPKEVKFADSVQVK